MQLFEKPFPTYEPAYGACNPTSRKAQRRRELIQERPVSWIGTEKPLQCGTRRHVRVETFDAIGDGLVVVEDEQAYAKVVREADDSSMLRQAFVARAGHCTFTPAETIAALGGLIRRLDTGKWQGINPNDLNEAAAALGPTFHIAPPSYLSFKPAPFLRPYDGLSH